MLKDVLKHLEELGIYKNPETAVITDIDGTISEIVPRPDEAEVDQEMRLILVEIQKRYKLLAFITGRPVESARKMVDIEDALYIGNHGMEYLQGNQIILDPEAANYQSQIRNIEEILKNKLDMDGIILENKRTSLAIHYRLIKNQQKAKTTILKIIKTINLSPDLAVFTGRKIIEIKPKTVNNKGTIITEIVKKYDIKQLIYAGDDTTDQDAFKIISKLNKNSFTGISIVVLSDETPQKVAEDADYSVGNIKELEEFFYWLLV
jgi:trehalose 6-phosphate phosphatase